MSSSNKVCFDSISGLYTKGAFFQTHTLKPKTRVEMRMIKASAFIRSTPEWSEHLSDKSKRQEWASHVKDAFNLIDKEVEYVFEELKYYALLKKNSVDGEELAGFDSVWINDSADDSELAKQIKSNAAVLESDFAQTCPSHSKSDPSADCQVLIDPFLYPFVAKESPILTKPIGSPEDSLDPELYRIYPGTLKAWSRTINYFNNSKSNSGDICGERKLSTLVNDAALVRRPSSPSPPTSLCLDDIYKCWLPTDFDVKEDGSVTIRSYINNLHPTRYAALYQTISSVFAKFVPLLEQVATDMNYPRDLRAVFSRQKCFVPGMVGSDEVTSLLYSGESLPEEYYRFVTTSSAYHPNGYGNSTTVSRGVPFDADAYSEAWEAALEYNEPAPEQFCPSKRPLVPLSMRGLPLQASVEMFNINLTPDSPKSVEGQWQTVGRAEERIFAVGLYFYDVENVTSAKLMFREPVSGSGYYHPDHLIDFRSGYDVDSVSRKALYITHNVGDIEIKSGRYICYPNYFQTKMPSFELADPTKAGHVKCIAFYIVDPTARYLSTEVIPPQQPGWDRVDQPPRVGVTDEDARIRRNELKTLHTTCGEGANGLFYVCIKDTY
ncbi:hypothetical protein IW152_000435 [Coemansia sp. BCRC 34962]|nr:hypothetical protein IW152_000435 [Coemansia sp. BCRC 34962]